MIDMKVASISLLLLLTTQAHAVDPLVHPPASTVVEVVDANNKLIGPVQRVESYGGYPEVTVIVNALGQFVLLPIHAARFVAPFDYLMFATPDCTGQAWIVQDEAPTLFAPVALVSPGNTLYVGDAHGVVERPYILSWKVPPEDIDNNPPDGCLGTSGFSLNAVRAEKALDLDTLYQPPFRLRNKKGR